MKASDIRRSDEQRANPDINLQEDDRQRIREVIAEMASRVSIVNPSIGAIRMTKIIIEKSEWSVSMISQYFQRLEVKRSIGVIVAILAGVFNSHMITRISNTL